MGKPSKADQAIIEAGRAHLRTWLEAAERHGTIYYNVQSVSRSGMNRKISLATIIHNENRDGKDTAELVRLWPSLPNDWEDKLGVRLRSADWNHALDVVARDWSFSFDKRAFNVGGCGMDMIFALVYDLTGKCFEHKRAHEMANKIRRESF